MTNFTSTMRYNHHYYTAKGKKKEKGKRKNRKKRRNSKKTNVDQESVGIFPFNIPMNKTYKAI